MLCTLRLTVPIRKVHIYIEYHSVCPLVRIGTLPPPLSPASVPPLPPEPGGGGGHTRLRVRVWGSPNSDDFGEKAQHWYLLFDLRASFSCWMSL